MRILVLFALISSNSFAAAPVSKAIQTARQLILKKDRVGALALLTTALEKEAHKPKGRAEVLREMDRLSKVFLSEEGQKNFELAESILYSGKPGSAEKYEEALTIENMNAEVLLGLVRSRLFEGNCSAASAALLQIDKINPFLPERKILKLKTELCLKQNIFGVETDPAFKDELKTEYKLVQAEIYFNQQKLKESAQALKEITDGKMPEVAYWNFKIHEPHAAEAVPYAEKYLDLCKDVTAVQRREYKLEPLLCKRTEEVVTYLKNNEASK